MQDKQHFKQTKIGWVKSSPTQLKETKGKVEDSEKEGKDPKNEELPIPKHRRRTKSWRYLIYVARVGDIWDVAISKNNILKLEHESTIATMLGTDFF